MKVSGVTALITQSPQQQFQSNNQDHTAWMHNPSPHKHNSSSTCSGVSHTTFTHNHSHVTTTTTTTNINLVAGGLIYVSGGDLKHRNGADVYYKFRPSSNFVYLTGVQEPGFACLLDPETQRFTLVAPQPHPDAELWSGGLPSLDVLAEQAGADACIYAGDLPSYLQQHHAGVFVCVHMCVHVYGSVCVCVVGVA